MFRRPVLTVLSLTLAASALPVLATGSASAATSPSGAVSVLAAPVAPLAATSTRLAVTSPKKFGEKLVVTAKVNGVSKPRVVFVVEANGTVKRVKATGNATGVAVAKFIAPYGGVVTAEYAGDATHDASTSAPKTFTAPSATTLKQRGYYKTVKGVRYYRSAAAVRLDALVRPKGQRYATITMEARSGSSWVVVDTTSGYTNIDGSVPITLTGASKNVTFRVRFSFAGDSLNRASAATPQLFRVG